MEAPHAALISACLSGDLRMVQKQVESHDLPETSLKYGLCVAAGSGQGAIVRYLLEQGARISQVAPIRAAAGNCLEVFQALIDYGWNVNNHALGQKVLPLVVENERLVRWFLDHDADPNCEPSSLPGQRGYTLGAALNAAAAFASVDTLNLLLERGARLELAQPLHSAASSTRPDGDRLAMIDRLLELGVDVIAPGDYLGPHREGTPVQHALKAGNILTAQYLQERGVP